MEATFNSSTILFSITIFLGSLLFVILTWVNTNQRHSSRVLGLYVLLFNYFALLNFLLYSGFMEHWPYLYRTGRPLNYLPGVLVFLYIRSVLYGEQGFRRWDWLHIIPVIVCAVDLMPFYFVSRDEKLIQIRHFLENINIKDVYAEGWLPYQVHNTLIPLVIYIYIAMSGVLLYRASKSKIVPEFRQNTLIFNWLKTFLTIFFVFVTAWYLVFAIRYFLPNTSVILTQALIAAWLSLSTGVAMLFYPNILYGFQGRMPLREPESQKPEDIQPGPTYQEEPGIVLSDVRRNTYLQALEQIMESERPYLKPRYALTDLATSTGIPYYYLSAVINQEYGWNFNDYINWFRVKYVKTLMGQSEVNQYTLEGVAQMAGFGSRVTFARAFHKFEGCTPTEYLKRHFQVGGQA